MNNNLKTNKLKTSELKTFSLISIKDEHFKARYEVYNENTGDNHVITYENTVPVHHDLYEAMQRLVYHVSNFTGVVASLNITGYLRQNCGNAQLLTIYARVENYIGDQCGNLAGRFYLGRDEYASIDLLLEDLSACEREALSYIEKGKRIEHDAFIYLDDNELSTLKTAA